MKYWALDSVDVVVFVTIIQQLLQICSVHTAASCKGTCTTIASNCYWNNSPKDCNSYKVISPGVAIATGVFHRVLQLLQGYFTGSCNCYWIISQDLATVTGLFHWALQLLLHHFTGPCSYNWIILPQLWSKLSYLSFLWYMLTLCWSRNIQKACNNSPYDIVESKMKH